MTNTDIAEFVPNPVGPLSPAQAQDAMRVYQEISHALINPADDIQVIQTRKGPREFPKRSAFQKLANAYRVSTEILARELTHDSEGQLVRCDALVRATHPDGRYADGDGACAATEDRFRSNNDKIDHDLPATAVTRATNRAISNLVAFGAVSAEEAVVTDADTASAGEPAQLPGWAEPIADIKPFGENLERILAATANPQVARDEVGGMVWNACDSSVPRIVADTIELINQMLAQPAPAPPAGGWAPGSGLEGGTP